MTQGKQFLASNWSGLLSETVANVSSAAVVASVLVLAFFITIFFLHSGSQMWSWFVALLPYHRRAVTNRAAQAGWATFSGYARGTMLVAGTDGLFAAIFLQILGVPVAPALGILVHRRLHSAYRCSNSNDPCHDRCSAAKGIVTAAIVGLGIALIGRSKAIFFNHSSWGTRYPCTPLSWVLVSWWEPSPLDCWEQSLQSRSFR